MFCLLPVSCLTWMCRLQMFSLAISFLFFWNFGLRKMNNERREKKNKCTKRWHSRDAVNWICEENKINEKNRCDRKKNGNEHFEMKTNDSKIQQRRIAGNGEKGEERERERGGKKWIEREIYVAIDVFDLFNLKLAFTIFCSCCKW